MPRTPRVNGRFFDWAPGAADRGTGAGCALRGEAMVVRKIGDRYSLVTDNYGGPATIADVRKPCATISPLRYGGRKRRSQEFGPSVLR